MPGVHLMWVESSDIPSAAVPGQFIMISCDSGLERLLRRPISIHQAGTKSMAFLFAVAGAGTEWLAEKKAGDEIDLLGPMGNGFTISSKSHNLLLVAGGMGIAPLYFLTQSALKKDIRVKLLVGARTACQICPETLMPEGCDIVITTEDGTAGMQGMVTALLPEYADWADQVFACGPLPLYKSMAKHYRTQFKEKPVEISLEVRMGCGLGSCYACTVKTRQGLKQVCKDGPVFNMNDIFWDEML